MLLLLLLLLLLLISLLSIIHYITLLKSCSSHMVQSSSLELKAVITLVNYLVIYVSSRKKVNSKLCSCLLLSHWGEIVLMPYFS